MAHPLVRALGRSGFVALVCALGCATGTQGDGPLGDTLDEGGSTGTAGSATAGGAVGLADHLDDFVIGLEDGFEGGEAEFTGAGEDDVERRTDD